MPWSVGRNWDSGLGMDFSNFKAYPSGTLLLIRPHLPILLILSNSVTPWWLSIQISEPLGSILIQTITYVAFTGVYHHIFLSENLPCNNLLLLLLVMCVHMHVYKHTCAMMCVCGGQRTTLYAQFFPSTYTCILGLEYRLPGLYSKLLYLRKPSCQPQESTFKDKIGPQNNHY